MRKHILFLGLIILLLASCSDVDNMIEDPDDLDMMNPDTIMISDIDTVLATTITGYNMRWRNLADFETSQVLELTDSLGPEILRYSGGSLAYKWDWKTGRSSDDINMNDVSHPISDLKKMAEYTGAEVTFVLDIINGTLEDQIEMLHASELPIKYIEVGNELYLDNYEPFFPSGKVYADTINRWTPVLRSLFPEAKFGIAMIGRDSNEPRKQNWNTEVHDNISVSVEAYIYHVYVGETETVDERIDRLWQKYLYDTGKETWITEYGAKSQNVEQAIELAQKIDAIADISLNHVLLSGSGNFSKLTDDCNGLTEEGRAFVERYGK